MNSSTKDLIYEKLPIAKEIPAILDKFVVDFANSIDVTNDHVRVQKTHNNLFSRMFDGITGTGAKRQNAINEHNSKTLESSLRLLTELANDVAQSHRTISLVNERVTHLKSCVAELTDYSVDTRQLFEEFAAQTKDRLDKLEGRLDADEHMRSVLAQWKAGRFNGLSPYAQCHLALQQLSWGDWGSWWRMQDKRTQEKKYKFVRNECISALADSLDLKSDQGININQWLFSDNKNPELVQANQYLGDMSDKKHSPYTYIASQGYDDSLLRIPLYPDAPRLIRPLINEVLDYVE